MKLIIYGMIIGIANIIPGVSGGTMAVILGLYDKIISSVSNIRTNFRESLKFLCPIGIGAGLGILLFSKIIEYTLANFNVATNMVFVGLILGSIPMIYKSSNKKSLSSYLSFLVCLIVMLLMNFITPDDTNAKVITTLSVFSFFKILFISIISSGAMIIPGISGSFIMLLFGMYTTVIAAISDFNILILIPVGLGAIIGILGFAKIIEKLFKNFKDQTYFGILGFMIGSITVIFPTLSINIELFISIILLVLSAITAYMFSKK